MGAWWSRRAIIHNVQARSKANHKSLHSLYPQFSWPNSGIGSDWPKRQFLLLYFHSQHSELQRFRLSCLPAIPWRSLPQPQWYQAFPIQTTLKISSYSGEAPSFLGRIEAANFISFHRLPEGFPPTWSYGGTGQQNISSSFQWQTQSLRPGCPSLCIWNLLGWGKHTKIGTGVNNPSCYIWVLIMQTTDKHRTRANLLSVNHAGTQILMLLFGLDSLMSILLLNE